MKKATELIPATLIQKKAASVGSLNLNGRSPLASLANEAIGAGAARIRHPLDVTAPTALRPLRPRTQNG